MALPEASEIEQFMHDQVNAWNSSDGDRFFNAYEKIAPGGIEIEYVGGVKSEGGAILKDMWSQQQAKINIEEKALVVIGNEAVAHNHNVVKGTDMIIDTIEHYTFAEDGSLFIRYFIKPPQS